MVVVVVVGKNIVVHFSQVDLPVTKNLLLGRRKLASRSASESSAQPAEFVISSIMNIIVDERCAESIIHLWLCRGVAPLQLTHDPSMIHHRHNKESSLLWYVLHYSLPLPV